MYANIIIKMYILSIKFCLINFDLIHKKSILCRLYYVDAFDGLKFHDLTPTLCFLFLWPKSSILFYQFTFFSP